jgi:hypothetical protein
VSNFHIGSVNGTNNIFGDNNVQHNFTSLAERIERGAGQLPNAAEAHRALTELRGACSSAQVDADRANAAADRLSVATAGDQEIQKEITELLGRITRTGN